MPTREELIALALRAKVPVATLDPTCKWVSSKDQAAVDAFNQIPAQKKEQAGAIYKNTDGEFCYSIPVPGGDKEFTFKTDRSGGLEFDGIYHTHPNSGTKTSQKMSRDFSYDDVEMAKQLGKDSYIRVDETDDIKKFTPGVTKIDFSKGSPGDLIPELLRQRKMANNGE